LDNLIKFINIQKHVTRDQITNELVDLYDTNKIPHTLHGLNLILTIIKRDNLLQQILDMPNKKQTLYGSHITPELIEELHSYNPNPKFSSFSSASTNNISQESFINKLNKYSNLELLVIRGYIKISTGGGIKTGNGLKPHQHQVNNKYYVDLEKLKKIF